MLMALTKTEKFKEIKNHAPQKGSAELLFLGTGSAFTIGDGNYQSNMLIVAPNGKKLLIDCGSDIRFSLYEQDLIYKDIDAVYISHLHTDHIGGLEWLAFTKYFLDSKAKPLLFINKGLKKGLWNSISPGLSSLETEKATLEHYFDVHLLGNKSSFYWEKIHFQLVSTIHVMSDRISMPSFGLFITANSESIFITTDTCFTPNLLMTYYKKASVIFHDCETSRVKSSVHASYPSLKTLPSEIKSKMWLYHYNPGKLPDAKKDGFQGFVKKGQLFKF